ncbi:TPA: type II secretion system protein GspG [Candidatus Poribacteria bacterium]|nr:type II secretion system protein GspG [Candidatus Poribacteria bacterium]
MLFKKIREDQRGITLIELLVVITILGILATAVVTSGIMKAPGKAKVGVAMTSIQSFEASLNHYAIDVGNYPSTEEGLEALWQAPDEADGWDGPYVQKPQFIDPWKNPYIYRSPSERPGYEYEIVSMGPDGKEGTEDDITSWVEEEEMR